VFYSGQGSETALPHDQNLSSSLSEKSIPDRESYSTCEYTGKLWFLTNTGVRFKETVRIRDLSKCGSYSSVECVTQYKAGKEWVDCSKVTCSFSMPDQSTRNRDGVFMDVVTDLLVTIPLPGVKSFMRTKINDTYTHAAKAFFDQKHL